MDDRKHSISPDALYARLGSETTPIVVDVRRDADFAGADTLVADAFHCSPDNVEQWQADLPSGRQVVTHCFHGQQVSQGVAAALRIIGVEADFLEGGIANWTEQELPTRRNIGATPSKWVTRVHPKIEDRLPLADPALHRSQCRVHLRPEGSAIDQRTLYEGNSVLRGGQTPRIEDSARSTDKLEII